MAELKDYRANITFGGHVPGQVLEGLDPSNPEVARYIANGYISEIKGTTVEVADAEPVEAEGVELSDTGESPAAADTPDDDAASDDDAGEDEAPEETSGFRAWGNNG